MPHRATAGHKISELLLNEGLITNDQLDAALIRQKETDLSLLRILVETGNLDENKRLNFFKRQFGVPTISLKANDIDSGVFSQIPFAVARRHHLVPVRMDRDGLVVAMEDPSDVILLDTLKDIVGSRIKPVLAHSSEIEAVLEQYPSEQETGAATGPTRKFDPAVRLLSVLFMPIMSIAALLGIMLLIAFNSGVQNWLQTRLQATPSINSQYFSLFLYFISSWGVWTVLMWEIQGLAFDDLAWNDEAQVGEPRSRGTALILSVLFGWLGVDRWYLGYRLMFCLKLLTLGMLGLWWLLDIFLLATSSLPDAAGRDLA